MREEHVFASLAQSGEGEVICKYIDRVFAEVTAQILDDESTTLEDIKGARLTRQVLKELQERLRPRDIIRATQSELS